MKMTKKRVSELEGAQLDWAVAIASGFTRARMSDVYLGEWIMPNGKQVFLPWFNPSTDWRRGGPIIERERITIDPIEENQWAAHIVSVSVKGGWLRIIGPTPLIAAMRAFVASKLGDEVEVPK